MNLKSVEVVLDQKMRDRLRQDASRVALNAYAPYSKFLVGAAVLLSSGEIVTGCNVENASFRLTTCAEQTAIVRAVARFGPEVRVVALALANADTSVACQPCGACRQTLAEFAAEDCLVLYPGDGGRAAECTLRDLLPAGFSAASLSS